MTSIVRVKADAPFPNRRTGVAMGNKYQIKILVNGNECDLLVRPDRTLLDVLRNDLGLTGTKEGCGQGDCGACTVLIDGKVATSCIVLAVEVDGAVVTTIEGLQEGDALHPIQQAFVERGIAITLACADGEIMQIVSKPEAMSQEEAEQLVYSDEFFTIKGPWDFTFNLAQ